VTNGTQWRSWLDSDHWFNDLPTSLQDSLLVGMRQRRFTPGKLIFEHGEAPCGLYALLSGSIRFNGVKQQRDWLPPAKTPRPYWFGEVSLFDGLPRLHDVFAQDQIIVLHLPHTSLSKMLEDNPHHWRYFARLLGRKLGLEVPPNDQVTLMPTDERVAFRLLLLTEGYGDLDHSTRTVSVNDVLSDTRLGLAPEVVDRVITQFAERGIVRRDGDFICVTDVERLRKAARHRLTGG
jgi:CRP/FNR family transcriptional regulator, cyclic AMP receptor protein